jgi:hypothetical protein
LGLYERGLDRAQKFLSDLVRLNLDERQAKLEESHVAMIGDAIRAGVAAAVPPEMQWDVLAAASRYLLTIDATAREVRPPAATDESSRSQPTQGRSGVMRSDRAAPIPVHSLLNP